MPNDNLEFQQRLQTVFFELLRDWACVNVGEQHFFEGGSGSTEISVTPIQSQLFFQVTSSKPDIATEIVDAGGNLIAEDAPNVTVVESADWSRTYSIVRPEGNVGYSGAW